MFNVPYVPFTSIILNIDAMRLIRNRQAFDSGHLVCNYIFRLKVIWRGACPASTGSRLLLGRGIYFATRFFGRLMEIGRKWAKWDKEKQNSFYNVPRACWRVV